MTYLVALLSGLLTALPLLFDVFFFLPWFSLVPLLLIAKKKRSAYRHGLVFSLGYYGVLYHWFCYLYPLDFVGLGKAESLAVVAVAWIGMSLLQGAGTALVPFLYRHLTDKRKTILAPFAAASLWCVMEWLQTQFWFGVPWGRLAVTQYARLPLIQSASVFGSLGIGFLMVLVNGFLAVALEKWWETKSWKQPAALVALLLFVGNLTFGVIALSVPNKPKETFVAAAIQGNIASGDKWADDSVMTSFQVFSALTEKAVEESGASLVVWPETALPISLNQHAAAIQLIGELAQNTGAHIVVGAFHRQDGIEGETHNSLYLFSPDGELSETVYHKRRLVPFGEYLPMAESISDIFPALAQMNLFTDSLSSGDESSLFDCELGTIGSLICFDSIYESLALDSVREGAEIMLLGTNDSWYEDSAAVYQHNGHAVLRAVETGRSFVRAANTGISSIITEKGQIKAYLAPLVTGYTACEVSTYDQTTVYTAVGNLIVWLSMGYLLTLAALRLLDRFNAKKQRG